MQRWVSILLGAAVIVLAAWLSFANIKPRKEVQLMIDAAGVIGPAPALDFDAAPVDDLPAFTGPDNRADAGGIGNRMPDGTPVPRLPEHAPKSVRFGVVLVEYAGSEGAKPTARAKKDALDLAVKLAGDARSDFHGAVRRGDDGSTDDAGRIQRGILELAVEYFLFTLPVGEVSDPIDTPRGFWIVKRLE